MKISIGVRNIMKSIDLYFEKIEKKDRDELIMFGFKTLGVLAIINLLIFGISLRYMNGWVSLLQFIFITITVFFWMCFVGMASVK